MVEKYVARRLYTLLNQRYYFIADVSAWIIRI